MVVIKLYENSALAKGAIFIEVEIWLIRIKARRKLLRKIQSSTYLKG